VTFVPRWSALCNLSVCGIVRLTPSPVYATPDANPFEVTPLQDALASTQSTSTLNESRPGQSPNNLRRSATCELEWSLSEGLLATLFFLSELYFLRGSPRDAEYFACQAAELAEQLNAPAMASRALARLGDVQLHMGRLKDAHSSLTRAGDLLQDMPGLDAADIRRLKMEYGLRTSEDHEPTEIFEETVKMFEELEMRFNNLIPLRLGTYWWINSRQPLFNPTVS